LSLQQLQITRAYRQTLPSTTQEEVHGCRGQPSSAASSLRNLQTLRAPCNSMPVTLLHVQPARPRVQGLPRPYQQAEDQGDITAKPAWGQPGARTIFPPRTKAGTGSVTSGDETAPGQASPGSQSSSLFNQDSTFIGQLSVQGRRGFHLFSKGLPVNRPCSPSSVCGALRTTCHSTQQERQSCNQ
jgi:hypothetical protein